MTKESFIVFVCEHGAAKSVIAAAYFNCLASAANLNLYAIARGTNPELEYSAKTIEGLRQDGVMLPENTPQKLTLADMESAQRIISFCNLPEEYQHIPITELWNDVPPVSENYEEARDKIIAHLEKVIKQSL